MFVRTVQYSIFTIPFLYNQYGKKSVEKKKSFNMAEKVSMAELLLGLGWQKFSGQAPVPRDLLG